MSTSHDGSALRGLTLAGRARSLCLLLAAGALTTAGCGSQSNRNNSAAGGTSGAAASSGASSAGEDASGGNVGGAGGGAEVGGGGGAGGGRPGACPEAPALAHPGGARLALTFAPVLGAATPMLVGEPTPVAGGQLTPFNARFYFSEPTLLREDGTALNADLVTESGSAAPYGVHLVDFDEPASATLRLSAPPGTYTGLRFTLGLNDACNGAGETKPPLGFDSQMQWPHLAGYLFLRYEGQYTPDAAPGAEAPPSAIHMGGLVGRLFAPKASFAGPLTLLATGEQTATVRMSFDEIFRGATSSVDVSDTALPGAEVIAGERLRRAVPDLAIFTLLSP
jgi:hypothetical protein